MTLLDLDRIFGNAKVLKCKQASIDTWEEIEETITQWQDREVPFDTAIGAIHYDVTTILEILDKELYDFNFWKEVEAALSNIKED